MRVAADRTPAARPFLKTGAMEDMLAEDRKEAGRFVHTF